MTEESSLPQLAYLNSLIKQSTLNLPINLFHFQLTRVVVSWYSVLLLLLTSYEAPM